MWGEGGEYDCTDYSNSTEIVNQWKEVTNEFQLTREIPLKRSAFTDEV